MSSKDIQNQYSKELSKKYNSDYRFDHPHQFMAYFSWLAKMGDIHGKRILDLACGSGTSTRMLSDKGASVVGVDISESMLEIAVQHEKDTPTGNTYILSDASIPKSYDEKPFDMVVAAFLLHYARNYSVLEGFIKNISLNVKSGGTFISINLSPTHPIVTPGVNISHSSRWLGEPFKDGSPLEVILWSPDNKPVVTLTDYHWSKETYEKIFKEAGFSNVEWKEIKMHEEGKTLENWKDLERNNMLVILRATKSL